MSNQTSAASTLESNVTTAKRVIKNSLANAVTGASSAVISIVIPAILARKVSSAEFSVWALILQMAAYTALLGLGMQVAVGRFVAVAIAQANLRYASGIASTAAVILSGCLVVAAVAVMAAALNLPSLIPAIPPELESVAQFNLIVIGGALALGLPFLAFGGIFIGLQRNEIVAMITGGSRLVLAMLLITIVLCGGGLKLMALTMAATYLVSYWLQWFVCRCWIPDIQVSYQFASARVARELFTYCATIMVWNVAMLFINGLDTAIVSRVDFGATAAYAACAGVVTFVAGVQSSLFSPIIQLAAALGERSAFGELRALFIRSTRLSAVLLFALATPILLFAKPLVGLWLGPDYQEIAAPILSVVVCANVLRLVAAPFALILLATGGHRKVITGPIVEALVNFTFAVVAGQKFGAIGVAYGALAGATTAQLINYFVNLRRAQSLKDAGPQLLRQSLGLPLACFTPALIVLLMPDVQWATWLLRAVVLLLSFILAYRFALTSADRDAVIGMAIRKSRRSARNHDSKA